MVYAIFIAAAIAYFLGNLNGAVLISALLHDDVRSHGSGNAGLTNFIRNFGSGRALYVVAIDMGKAVLACESARLILNPYMPDASGTAVGALCVLLGHIFPVLLGFKGGALREFYMRLYEKIIKFWRYFYGKQIKQNQKLRKGKQRFYYGCVWNDYGLHDGMLCGL